MNEQSNIYLPHLMVIEKITHEAPGVKTFRLRFKDEKEGEAFHFKAGQFGEYSAFGEGESTFCIASSPTRKGYIECTFRQAGRVTTGLAKLEEGATVGFRGPFGNTFPLDEWKGKNLLFVAGGIALPPMRCVIWNALDRRPRFIMFYFGKAVILSIIIISSSTRGKEKISRMVLGHSGNCRTAI